MLRAIAGDIIGSIYERNDIKFTDFPLFREENRFADDAVLTITTADCLLNNKDFRKMYQKYCQRYPNAGYGEIFLWWGFSRDTKPYNGWGNGSAMRSNPVGFFITNLMKS